MTCLKLALGVLFVITLVFANADIETEENVLVLTKVKHFILCKLIRILGQF